MKSHVIDALPDYALGTLQEDEARQITAHLPLCSSCRAELLTYEAIVAQLALAAADAEPPPRVKQRLMQSIQRPLASLSEAPSPARGLRFARRGPAERVSLWGRIAPVWGAVSLLLVVALLVSNVWLWQRSDRKRHMITPGGMQIIAMAGTSAAPEATGTLVISDDGEYGTLVVDGLPVPGPDRQYQLWLIRHGQRTSGGVFSVNDEGYGALWIEAPEPLASFPSFGITVEPAGGSPAPTGERVLEGHL